MESILGTFTFLSGRSDVASFCADVETAIQSTVALRCFGVAGLLESLSPFVCKYELFPIFFFIFMRINSSVACPCITKLACVAPAKTSLLTHIVHTYA